ncbi:MAG: pyrroline-5-carboxylate reductase [Simkaniaceae bacterium]|nr:pyrroline-5-carboxylate reductase [Simkaniaceae bacterium]
MRRQVGILGAGVMGNAIAERLVPDVSVYIYDHKEIDRRSPARREGITVIESVSELTERADVLFIAVQPKDLRVVSDSLSPFLRDRHRIVSILAGTTLDVLRSHFPETRLFRTMPNLLLTRGKGVFGIVDDPSYDRDERGEMENLLSPLGEVVRLDEGVMDAFSALTGSGPAFICLIIEAMIDAGISLGLKEHEALHYALRTVEGTAGFLREEGTFPETLRRRISSPGGTTIEGLNELEHQKVRSGIIKCLRACHQKAKTLR